MPLVRAARYDGVSIPLLLRCSSFLTKWCGAATFVPASDGFSPGAGHFAMIAGEGQPSAEQRTKNRAACLCSLYSVLCSHQSASQTRTSGLPGGAAGGGGKKPAPSGAARARGRLRRAALI